MARAYRKASRLGGEKGRLMPVVPEHMESDAKRIVRLYDSMVAEERKEGVEVYSKSAWQRTAKDAVKMLRDLLETETAK